MVALRPTHFLALRLGDPLLHEAVRHTQATVVSRDPTLAPCAVPPERSHLTCLVFQANSDDDLRAASEELASCGALANAEFGGDLPTVKIRGLGHFGQNVLFAELEAGPEKERLCKFVDDVRERFAERNLLRGTNEASWTPHVTLMKTSRVRSRSRRLAIRPAAYEGLEPDLGTHAFEALELCAMAGADSDGFYPVLDSLRFRQSRPSAEVASSEPCPPHPSSLPLPSFTNGGEALRDATAEGAATTNPDAEQTGIDKPRTRSKEPRLDSSFPSEKRDDEQTMRG